MKGWYGNRQEHSLASRGIKSKKFCARGKEHVVEDIWFLGTESLQQRDRIIEFMREHEVAILGELDYDTLVDFYHELRAMGD